MTGKEILVSDFLDIVFDKRNKTYGAYWLRKTYNQRLFLSLTLALSSVFLLFFMIRPGNSTEDFGVPKNTVIIRELYVPPPKEPKQPVSDGHKAARSTAATRTFPNQVQVVPNTKLITDPMPSQVEMLPALPSTLSGEGTVPGGGSSDHARAPEPARADPAPAMVPLQREPEFPGGPAAWHNYLSRNLRVPGTLQEGENVTVLIRFQVAADGMVTGFEILRSGGREYDQEVIRVLKRMPRWKPAIRDNQPVAWFYSQPVTFMGVGE